MPETREANFAWLLAGLLATLLAGPAIRDLTPMSPGIIVQLSFSATLIIGVWSLARSRTWFMFGVALATINVTAMAVNLVMPSSWLELATLLATFTFCLISMLFSGRHVLLDNRVDANRMIGAVCVYLLLGVLIAILNMLLFRYVAGSFTGLSAADRQTGQELIYYTFVTMTTLGYGDVTPAGPLARAVGYLTAIAGQFYIAILVGMLVGLFLSRKASD